MNKTVVIVVMLMVLGLLIVACGPSNLVTSSATRGLSDDEVPLRSMNETQNHPASNIITAHVR